MSHDQEVERFTHAGLTVRIVYDPDAESPRENAGNLATIVGWHRRYKIGDRKIEPLTEKELRKGLKDADEKILALLPLYMYEHSGTCLRAEAANPFHDRFDSGQVGWAYVLDSTARSADNGCTPGKRFSYVFDGKKVTGKYDRAFFEKAIRDEVALYDDWANGRFTGYIVEDEDGEHVDSCWGFDDADYCREQAKEAAEHAAENVKKEQERFPVSAWQVAVADGLTQDSYTDWVKGMVAYSKRILTSSIEKAG